MARPKVSVQHFVVCRAAPWEGPAGPKTPRTLEGVSYRYGVPPGTEFPFEVEELWTYLRLFNMNGGVGSVPFFLALIWQDSSGGSRRVWTRQYARIPFRPNRAVVEAAFSIRPVTFPGPGWFEFRLLREVRLRIGSRRLVIAREHLLIET